MSATRSAFSRVASAWIHIPYPWVLGEAHKVKVVRGLEVVTRDLAASRRGGGLHRAQDGAVVDVDRGGRGSVTGPEGRLERDSGPVDHRVDGLPRRVGEVEDPDRVRAVQVDELLHECERLVAPDA